MLKWEVIRPNRIWIQYDNLGNEYGVILRTSYKERSFHYLGNPDSLWHFRLTGSAKTFDLARKSVESFNREKR